MLYIQWLMVVKPVWLLKCGDFEIKWLTRSSVREKEVMLERTDQSFIIFD